MQPHGAQERWFIQERSFKNVEETGNLGRTHMSIEPHFLSALQNSSCPSPFIPDKFASQISNSEINGLAHCIVLLKERFSKYCIVRWNAEEIRDQLQPETQVITLNIYIRLSFWRAMAELPRSSHYWPWPSATNWCETPLSTPDCHPRPVGARSFDRPIQFSRSVSGTGKADGLVPFNVGETIFPLGRWQLRTKQDQLLRALIHAPLAPQGERKSAREVSSSIGTP
jgi:hypothetical protein